MKKLVCLCLLGILVFTSGCEKKNDNDSETEANATVSEAENIDIPSNYENSDGKVEFNLDIEGNSDEDLYVMDANLINVDTSEAASFLDGEKDYEEDNIYDRSYYSNDDGFALDFGPDSSNFSYHRGNSNFDYIIAAFRLEKKFDDYNADKYSKDTDLAFMSRDDAYSKVLDELQKLGLKADYEYTSYALDYNTLQKEEVHLAQEGDTDKSAYKDHWSESDDSYYFAIRQLYSGIPVYYPFTGEFVDECEENYTISSLVDKDGIIDLSVDNVYSFSNEKKVSKLADFDTIFKTVSEKYNSVLGDSSYKFDTAELVYYVDLSSQNGTYKTTPVWIIKGQEEAGGGDNETQIFIDAQDGTEVIPWTKEL